MRRGIAAFFWRARNSARIARTLEKCVSCESALGRVALVANAMGRGRLFPRSGQVGAEPRCLYGVNAIQIRSLQNRFRGPEDAPLLAFPEASSCPSRGGCVAGTRCESRASARPASAIAAGVRHARDRRPREVRRHLRREASRGVGRRALPSPKDPSAHDGPRPKGACLGRPTSRREAAGLGKRGSVLHNPLLAVQNPEALVFAICKTHFSRTGDAGRSSKFCR